MARPQRKYGRAMPDLNDALEVANTLSPADRLRLISRIADSLPRDLPWPHVENEGPEVKRSPVRDVASLSRKRSRESQREVKSLGDHWARFSAREDPSAPTLYAAPRRFDLATMFVVMAAYALLFTGLTLLDFQPVSKQVIAALITVVGIGQALLLNVFNPRAASILVGAAAYTLFSLIIWIFFFPSSFFALVVINGMIGGSILGYLAGVLVGGVFLVADFCRRQFIAAEPDGREEGASHFEPGSV